MKGIKLISEINKMRNKWDERSSFSIKGVKNLSRSDLDTLVLYAQTYDNQGNFYGLMDPRGDIKVVLDIYGITPVSSWM